MNLFLIRNICSNAFFVEIGIIIRNLAFARYERLLKVCSIALVGKYTKLSDCYASVFKALEHSALAINHKLDLMVSICPFSFSRMLQPAMS